MLLRYYAQEVQMTQSARDTNKQKEKIRIAIAMVEQAGIEPAS